MPICILIWTSRSRSRHIYTHTLSKKAYKVPYYLLITILEYAQMDTYKDTT